MEKDLKLHYHESINHSEDRGRYSLLVYGCEQAENSYCHLARKLYDECERKVFMGKSRHYMSEGFLLHLGDAIRNRRVSLYLSQEELGLRANLGRTYITAVENGLRNISMITLLRISRALKNRPSVQILAAEKAADLAE
jgi:DNA-binding XRE family transcriptional regulator